MENQIYTNPLPQKKALLWPFYFCFLIFGILSGLAGSQFNLLHFSLALMLAMVIGMGMILLLVLLLKAINKSLIPALGSDCVKGATARGLVFMIPFTTLALLAFFVLGWQAIMPFAAAAITTSAAGAGTEMIKQGGHPLKNVIVPSLLGMVFSTGWMLILSLLP